jgi:ATP-dependent exoDNAse (exonuclease V) beta subunit
VAEELADQVRLMYVGMTRARSRLLITSSESTPFTERLVELVVP